MAERTPKMDARMEFLSRNRLALWGVGICCVFLCLAAALAWNKRPWCDEACFANPAVDLITRGTMGMPSVSPQPETNMFSGQVTIGQNRHMYAVMPLDILLHAAWFKLAGVGRFTMRSPHILMGLILILSWGWLVRRLTGSGAAALLALALLAVDRFVLLASSDGRPDVASMAFATAALVVYLRYRERHLGPAIFAANLLFAASFFCHPVGCCAYLPFLYFVWKLDRARIAWKHLFLAAAPFVLSFGLWGWYISLDPVAFRSQFLPNAGSGSRFRGWAHPWVGFFAEINRYLRAYIPGYAAGLRRVMVVIPILYAWPILMLCLDRGVRKVPGALFFGGLGVAYFVVFAVGEGSKQLVYVAYLTPLACCCAGIWVWWLWQRGGWRRTVAGALVGILVVFQLAWTADTIRSNPYARSYAPVIAYLHQHATASSLIIGGPELTFGLGFYGPLRDDPWLLSRSSNPADFVVVDDKCYGQYYPDMDAVLYPRFEKVFTAGDTRIYARRGMAPVP